MSTNDYEKMFEHEHDGITEYDNPLPGWFTWLFILSIVFSFAYVSWYHIGLGPSVHDKHEAETVAHIEKLLAVLGEVAPDNATIVKFMHNEDWMSAMSGVFVGNCAQCHANDGGGNIGPNLTDEFYKNVKTPADIFTVISEGVDGTAMAPWKERLREPQMILLASYVASLRGTTPAISKEREGDPIDAWPALEDIAPTEDEGAGEEAPGESGA